nr:transposase [Streptomyces collinus]
MLNTRYLDAALDRLCADRFDVREQDAARLSPFVRHHVNMLGRYSFLLPEMPGGLRPLRGSRSCGRTHVSRSRQPC